MHSNPLPSGVHDFQLDVTLIDLLMIVLVVDDDQITRTFLSRTLSRLGCNVSTAENGEIALDMIVGGSSLEDRNTNTKPHLTAAVMLDGPSTRHDDTSVTYNYDVIFLDNQMPILSGLETVTKLRDMGRHDFVVGVTGKIVD